MGKSAFIIYHFQICRRTPFYSITSQRMRLQLEILPRPAAWWGEDASILVAAGATVLLVQECPRGKGNPGWSGIIVFRWQWLPPLLPPSCQLPPPQLLCSLKLISPSATATAALMTTAAAARLLSRWGIKARPPSSVFLVMSDASCWIKRRQMLRRGIQMCPLLRSQ
jgi:hypothetical protein